MIELADSNSGVTLGTTIEIPGLMDAASDAADNPSCLILMQLVMGADTSGSNRLLCTSSTGEEFNIDMRPGTPDVRIRLTDDVGNVRTARCDLSASPLEGDRMLIGAMMENRTGNTSRGHILCSWSRGGTVYNEAPAAQAAVTSGELRANNQAIVVGGNDAGTAAACGIIGIAVWTIPHGVDVIDQMDMQAIFEDAHPASTWRPPALLTGAGALLENATLEMVMMHGALSTNRKTVGDEVVTGNSLPVFLAGNNFDDIQTVTVTGTATKISAFDESDEFVRTYPNRDDGESVPGSAVISGRILRGNVASSIRFLTNGNSLTTYYESQTDSGYPHSIFGGILNYKESEISGALMLRPTLGSGGNYERPFYDHVDDAAYTSGTVVESDTDLSNYGRIGSTSDRGNRGGPGCGVEMSPGSVLALRAFEYGLATDERAMTHEVLLLKGVPGQSSYSVSVQGNVHTQQGGAAGTTEGDAQVVTLSPATSAAYDLSSESTFVSASGTTLVLSGDLTGTFSAGMVFGWDNGTRYDFNVAATVTYDGGGDETTITFEQAWGAAASIGATDTFYYTSDELEIVKVTIDNDPVAGGNIARGFSITFSGSAGDPSVYFMGASPSTPDAEGLIPGPLGWGGNNYESHLDETFTGMYAKLVEALAPDAVWFFFANNREGGGSVPDPDPMFDDIIAATAVGAPDAELVIISNPIQMENATGDDWADGDIWGQYAQELAETGVVSAYLNIVDATNMGDAATQYADGMCQDSGHKSTRGNTAIAEAIWTLGLSVFRASLGGAHTRARARRRATPVTDYL